MTISNGLARFSALNRGSIYEGYVTPQGALEPASAARIQNWCAVRSHVKYNSQNRIMSPKIVSSFGDASRSVNTAAYGPRIFSVGLSRRPEKNFKNESRDEIS